MEMIGVSVSASMVGARGSRTFRVFKVTHTKDPVPRIVSCLDIQFLSEVFPLGRLNNFNAKERKTLISRLELLRPELEGAHKRATTAAATVARLQAENQQLTQTLTLLKSDSMRGGHVDVVKMRKHFEALKDFFAETVESTSPPKRARYNSLGPEGQEQIETDIVMVADEGSIVYDLQALYPIQHNEFTVELEKHLESGDNYIKRGGQETVDDDNHRIAYAYGLMKHGYGSDTVTSFFFIGCGNMHLFIICVVFFSYAA